MGCYLRRLKAKLGPAGAITATARKLATIFYAISATKPSPTILDGTEAKLNAIKSCGSN